MGCELVHGGPWSTDALEGIRPPEKGSRGEDEAGCAAASSRDFVVQII